MRANLEKYLVKKFPLCFGDYNKSMKETCMCWGCDCGSGWYGIIKEACEKAEPIIAKWIEDNKTEPSIYIYEWFPLWFPEEISKPIIKIFLLFIFKFFPRFASKITVKHIRNWAPRLSQVKEKYGTLRTYWSGYPDGLGEVESEAEEKSARTCETCGKPGKLRGQGWYYTSCFKHAKKEDRESLEIVEAASIKKEKKLCQDENAPPKDA